METAIFKEHIWTFTRSTGTVRPSLENEGLVLRASWNHHDVHFQVWEPEVVRLPLPPSPMHDDFFMTEEGAPHVHIMPDGPANLDENEAYLTTHAANIDWVAARNPTFQIPNVIYCTRRCRARCEIISQPPGHLLNSVLYTIIKTDDEEYLRELPPDAAEVIEANQICARVAARVADAIVEMSTWYRPPSVVGVSGIDGGIIPDVNLGENHKPLTKHEINQNLAYAQLDTVNTIFSVNDISLSNIIVDEHFNFIGFYSLCNAGFVPRNWISFTLLEPEVIQAERLRMYHRAVLRDCKVRDNTRDSISYIWSRYLWAELAARGFEQVDAHLLPWRRDRNVGQHNRNRKWRELNEMMWTQGVRSWDELPEEPAPWTPEGFGKKKSPESPPGPAELTGCRVPGAWM